MGDNALPVRGVARTVGESADVQWAKHSVATTILVLLLSSSIAPAQTNGNAPARSITVGGPTIVIRNNQMNPSGVPWLSANARPSLDTVLSVIQKDNTTYWLNSRGNGNFAKFEGNATQPFRKMVAIEPMAKVFSDSELDATPNGLHPRYWIVNTYQDHDFVLAFIHVEHTNLAAKNPGQGRIGLATSTNYGDSFKYIGDIISPKDDSVFNVQGAPYIIKDGYFYVYAKERCVPSDANGFGGATIVARAPVKDVMLAAREGRVTEWNKYYEGGWNSPGIRGDCTGVSIAPDGIDHTDAAYSTYSKTYFLALSMNTGRGRRHTWVHLYKSTDGIHWTFVKDIVDAPPKGLGTGFQYVTIINDNGSGNAVIGKKFFVYSGGETPDSGPEGVVYRWPVEIGP